MTSFQELKRRKVFQVSALYAVMAWLVIQVVDVVSEPLALPEWLDTVVIILLAVGFPIAALAAWAFEIVPDRGVSARAVEVNRTGAQFGGQKLTYLMHGLVLLAVGFLVMDRYVLPPRPMAAGARAAIESTVQSGQTAVRRFSIILGTTEPVGNTMMGAHIALSRDGRRLAYVVQSEGRTQLYLRDIGDIEGQPMPGTNGAFYPTFSPDGGRLVFFGETDQKLKLSSVHGGPPHALADITFSSGAAWLDDDVIFGTADTGNVRTLFRVPAGGGSAKVLTPPGPNEGHVWPDVLPGGRAILFSVKPGPGGADPAREGAIAVLSLESGEVRVLVEGGHTPKYSPTGHILFARTGDLWAVPFDVDRLETNGVEARVIEGVQQDGFRGGAAYAISDNGMLVYAPGTDTTGNQQLLSLVWVDRHGQEIPLNAHPRAYSHMRLSPDGERLAIRVNDDGNQDIWIYNLVRGTSSRLTFSPSEEASPVWTPDGKRLIFGSNRKSGGIYWKAADNTTSAEPLLTGEGNLWPEAVSADGGQLVFERFGEAWDLHILSLNEASKPYPFIRFPGNQEFASISPDGRWIAYRSNETGRGEIYVQPFPDVSQGKWQISRDGGNDPVWAADGAELFFRSAAAMMAAEIDTDPAFSAGVPRALFEISDYAEPPFSYAVSTDGERFLMLKPITREPSARELTYLIVVENWFAELEQRVPSER